MSRISDNYFHILERIEKACSVAGRDPKEITLVGVTKTVDCDTICESIQCGIQVIGENRVQEFLEKYDVLKQKQVAFHLIGHLQTNKVKYIADKIDMIESVDSLKLLQEIDSQAKKHHRTIDCLIELNAAGEASKFGLNPECLEDFLYQAAAFTNVNIRGLMAIPPIFSDETNQRKIFSKLYQIFVDIKAKNIDNINMDYLSMGMSLDYYYAILEGANIVRIGTALFGTREKKLEGISYV